MKSSIGHCALHGVNLHSLSLSQEKRREDEISEDCDFFLH